MVSPESILDTAQIFTFSYLGDGPELRQRRLTSHITQMEFFSEHFANMVIVSYEMCYTDDEHEALQAAAPSVHSVRSPDRLRMGPARNVMLKHLYAHQGAPRYCAICDDDALTKDEEMGSGTETLRAFLEGRAAYEPEVVACNDIYRNFYYKKELRILEGRVRLQEEMPAMKGSMMIVRSTCGVLFEDLPYGEDGVFRIECMKRGVSVKRCSHLLLKELMRKETDSTVVEMMGKTHSGWHLEGKHEVARKFPRVLKVTKDGKLMFQGHKPPAIILSPDLSSVVSGSSMQGAFDL